MRLRPALVLLAAALPAAAKDLEMETRIRAEGFHRSQVMETAAQLTDVLGPRLTLSPQLKKANEWTRDQFARWGLENARLEAWGPFGVGWSLQHVSMHMTSPSVQPLFALPRAWSPGTKGVLKARALYLKLDRGADLDAMKGKVKDRIVLISAPAEVRDEGEAALERYDDAALDKIGAFDIPKDDPEEREWRRMVGYRDKLRKFLKDEGALAAVEVGRMQGAVRVGGTGAWKKDAERGVPWLTLMPEQYNRLVRLAERDLPVELEIDLRVTFHEDDLMGYNTLAEIPGGDRKDELVMAGAHLDSWHAATGATDNAAGSAVMMEAARILKALDAKPRRTIRFALWTGEEQTLGGSEGYVERHFAKRGETTDPKEKDLPAELQKKKGPYTFLPDYDKLSGYFNVDSGTGRIRGIYAQENAGAAAQLREWLSSFADIGVRTVTMNPDGDTDTEPFDEAGLPAFPFVQDAIEYRARTWHSSLDVYDRLKADDLKQAAVVVASVLYEAAMSDKPLPRKPRPK